MLKLIRILVSLVALIVVALVVFTLYKKELNEIEVIENGPTIEAEILKLQCGRRDHIKIRFGNTTDLVRIYLSNSECAQLDSQETIKIKRTKTGKILFAEKSYNDWAEAEIASIFLLGLFFFTLIAYYGLYPALKP